MKDGVFMWSSYGVKFKCPTCNETFTVRTKYLLDKDSVTCSCCDYKFPDEVISNIKKSIQYASKAFVFVRDNDLSNKLEFDFLTIPKED
ncbi:hypothetical protein [Terrisporobacter othiniensis]|nr:hypothetical protein [Terrisporobacter othiniensis]